MSCKHLYTSNYGEYYCETNGRFRKINQTSMGEPADCEWCDRYSFRAKDPEIVKAFAEFDAKNTSDILQREHDFWDDDEDEEIPHSKAYERSLQITLDRQKKEKLGNIINQYYKSLIMSLDDMCETELKKDAGTEWIEFETPDHFHAKCVLYPDGVVQIRIDEIGKVIYQEGKPDKDIII